LNLLCSPGGLELVIVLPLPPKCWGYKYAPHTWHNSSFNIKGTDKNQMKKHTEQGPGGPQTWNFHALFHGTVMIQHISVTNQKLHWASGIRVFIRVLLQGMIDWVIDTMPEPNIQAHPLWEIRLGPHGSHPLLFSHMAGTYHESLHLYKHMLWSWVSWVTKTFSILRKFQRFKFFLLRTKDKG
jgi:hypothetical protein